MLPKYDLDKIKFATDGATFEKAVALYESGKVTKFKEELNGFFAAVLGTKQYQVYVDNKHYDRGDCDCYLGQNDILCKHMVAVAIRAVTGGKPLSDDNKGLVSDIAFSNRPGILNEKELAEIKKSLTEALRYVKPYRGPSKTWFVYQNSLDEGCRRLAKIVSGLPASEQTAKLLVQFLLRLDDKLCHKGIDDSNGTVGNFIEGTVQVLGKFAALDPVCTNVFRELKNNETCFGWEEPLLNLLKKS